MSIQAQPARFGPKHLGHSLPLRWHEGPIVIPAFLLAGFALVFAQFPVSAATGWPLGGRAWCAPWMAWATAPLTWAISLGCLAVAWDWLVHDLDVEIDAARVRVRKRGIRGVREWMDPLGAYRGVLAREDYHSGGRNSPSYVEYRIDLVHGSDRERDVGLYRQTTPEGHREQTEGFARLLDLPVLVEQGDDRFRELDPDDLDKSIHELAREGKLDVGVETPQLPPGGHLEFEPTPTGFLFRTRRSRFVIPELIFGSFAVVWLVGWVLQEGPEFSHPGQWVGLAMGLAFASLGFGLAFLGRFGSVELRMDGGKLELRRLLLDRVTRSETLPRESVEEITIGAGRGGRRECVRIVGAGRQLEFGSTLSDDERQLVRRQVAARVVR